LPTSPIRTPSRATPRAPGQLPAEGRKLDMLDAAKDLMDLKSPPGNHLEKLKGDKAGRFSIRINDQYRIVFGWNHGNAENVKIEDYH